MAQPERPAKFRQTFLTTLHNWPLVVSTLVLVFFGPTSVPPRIAFVCDMLIVGTGTFLSGILLWLVALPRLKADPVDRFKTVEYQTAIAAPVTLLGALIAGMGGALYVVPETPTATNASCAVFFLLILAVLGTIMARAWRLWMVPPKSG